MKANKKEIILQLQLFLLIIFITIKKICIEIDISKIKQNKKMFN